MLVIINNRTTFTVIMQKAIIWYTVPYIIYLIEGVCVCMCIWKISKYP